MAEGLVIVMGTCLDEARISIIMEKDEQTSGLCGMHCVISHDGCEEELLLRQALGV